VREVNPQDRPESKNIIADDCMGGITGASKGEWVGKGAAKEREK